MDVSTACAARRSIRSFTQRSVTKEELERLFHDANLAPNHRLTQPWRFRVLGPEARYAYGMALGNRKAKRAATPEEAEKIRLETANKHRDLPGMIVVSMTLSENPEILEEDYAATMMAVEHICLSAVAIGLGTAIRTGAVMADPAARAAARMPDGERIVAVLEIGEPQEIPPPKPRQDVSNFTLWLD